jgi:hypothetical protein
MWHSNLVFQSSVHPCPQIPVKLWGAKISNAALRLEPTHPSTCRVHFCFAFTLFCSINLLCWSFLYVCPWILSLMRPRLSGPKTWWPKSDDSTILHLRNWQVLYIWQYSNVEQKEFTKPDGGIINLFCGLGRAIAMWHCLDKLKMHLSCRLASDSITWYRF